jgi:hypothetical protein
MDPEPGRGTTVRGFWEILWNGVPLEHGEMAMAVLFVLLGAIHLASRRLSLIRSCERCGTLICSRCSRSRVIGNQCVQCLNAFTANSNADPKVIRKKRAAVARYQSRLNFLPQRLSWILPGAGHLMRGRTGEGILYLFVLFLFLTRAIWWSGWIPNPLAPDSSLGIPGWSLRWACSSFSIFSFSTDKSDPSARGNGLSSKELKVSGLTGSLKDFGLTDLFQVLGQQRKTESSTWRG